jgi:hypothetical protein
MKVGGADKTALAHRKGIKGECEVKEVDGI